MAKSSSTTEKNTGMAVVAYLLFFVPLLTDASKDPFVKFHVKKGLLIVCGLVATAVVGWIPLIGWLIAMIAPILIFVLWIIGILNAVAGKKEPLPVIGKYAEEWFKF